MADKVEVWKDVIGYEGHYKVSSFGNIMALKRKVAHKTSGFITKPQRILKASKASNGYLTVSLYGKGELPKCVHSLVAIHFLGHIPSSYKMVVDHIDFNKLNNRADNLQIITNRANSSRAIRGTSKYVGVRFVKKLNNWRADIRINGVKKFLGNFINEELASLAYQSKLKTII